jgi:hypothetical protein
MNPNDYLTLFISLMVAIVASVAFASRHLSASRRAKTQLTSGKEYRSLAGEYRRLSDMAITAQEHVDLRLTDLSVRMDELHDQIDQMQRILKEVE